MQINRELLKGSTNILILSILDRQPMYGYQMIKEIEKKSSGVFKFKEGTLYPILHSLETEELIESYWDESDSGRKRKYYQITQKGKGQIKEKRQEWATFRTAVDQVIWEAGI